MADSAHGRAWPLADAQLTNQVSPMRCLNSAPKLIRIFYRFWSWSSKLVNTSSWRRELTRVGLSLQDSFINVNVHVQLPKLLTVVSQSSLSWLPILNLLRFCCIFLSFAKRRYVSTLGHFYLPFSLSDFVERSIYLLAIQGCFGTCLQRLSCCNLCQRHHRRVQGAL